MARHKQSYTGERRTVHIGFYATPSEAAELEAAASQQAANRSEYARELIFRRLGTLGTVARARRNPEAAGIMRDMLTAANQNSAAGNLMNQIARHAHMTGELADRHQALEEALALNRRATELHILALERVLQL
jgi:hypothetical protein